MQIDFRNWREKRKYVYSVSYWHDYIITYITAQFQTPKYLPHSLP